MRVQLIALIPAFNEETVIGKTIQSILLAGVKPEDIYVIDDASKDRTAEIVENLGVNVIKNKENLGKAQGVRRALSLISSSPRYKDLTHVSFLDADTLVDPKYFHVMRQHLSEDMRIYEKANKAGRKKKPIAVLCGRARSLPCNWLTAFRAYEYWLMQTVHKPSQSMLGVIMVAPGCASTYSLKALEETPLSDDTVVEDMDLTISIALKKERVVYDGRAVVYTQDPRRLRDYVNQLKNRWYMGTWQVIAKHNLLWKGETRLHWECRLMCGEPLIYFAILLFVLIFHPEKLAYMLGTVSAAIIFFAMVAAFMERRLDILIYSPIFPLLQFMNMFLSAFSVRGLFVNKKTQWRSPKRYDITTDSFNSKERKAS